MPISGGGGSSAAKASFGAQKASPSVDTTAANTYQKVICDSELYDTASWYDPVLGRFTPQTAATYAFFASAYVYINPGMISMALYKNGSFHKVIQTAASPAMGTGDGQFPAGSAQAQANGTTDYFEFWIKTANALTGGAPANGVQAGAQTAFSGHQI